MKRQFRAVVGLSAIALLTAAPLSFAEESNPSMHMHKTEMDHRSDKEVAAEYKTEAQTLREKAQSHHKLADMYKNRSPAKGGANYAHVAKHCENLAKFYEDAAKEAEAVETELEK